MKNMKILRVDGENWVKKSHYDKLEKRKTKVVKEEFNIKDMVCTDPANVIAIIQLDSFRKDGYIVIPRGKKKSAFRKFSGDIKVKNFSDKTDSPIIDINGNFYNYDYIIQAKQIAKALGTNCDYEPYLAVSGEKEPLLLDFINFGVLIAAREY